MRIPMIRGMVWKTILFLSIVLALPFTGAAAPAGGISWSYQLDFSSPTTARARQQADFIKPSLASDGVSTALTELSAGSKYRLEMQGSKDIAQLRETLFSDLLAAFLGGAAEVEISLPVDGKGDIFLKLESNPTTGYGWEFLAAESNGFSASEDGECLSSTHMLGASCVETLLLRPEGPAGGTIRLIYHRPFEPGEVPSRHVRLTLASAPAEIDLSDPHPQTASAQVGTGGNSAAALQSLPASVSLPAAWDWRDPIHGNIVPSIRNQGSCGSCWAFGTVGIMESAMAKGGGPLLNLSEQFLVSCNNYGWNCIYGGLTAHMYHYDTLGKNQKLIGAVLESDFPYTATNGSCTVTYKHPYRLTNWDFVGTDDWSTLTDDQLKTAIYTYGPITAAVCAGNAFQRYTSTSGIFQTNETCGGNPNHQIILVGWNDTGGYWILRNSWGTGWGENGYMRIKYGTSLVGEGASWVIWTPPHILYFPLNIR